MKPANAVKTGFQTQAEPSSMDKNRLYSILLDARASSRSENMFDFAEAILQREKEHAKRMLDTHWSLKNDILSEAASGTVDLLIRRYQEKLDILRDREERIKKVSKDSRGLLEEKRKKDEELATIKQAVDDCELEMKNLESKLHNLKTKEQELSLIEHELRKELLTNENEVVNGLYEIQAVDPSDAPFSTPAPFNPDAPLSGEPVYNEPSTGTGIEEALQNSGGTTRESERVFSPESDTSQTIIPMPSQPVTDVDQVSQQTQAVNSDFIRNEPEADLFVPGRSRVKTTSGIVIGEYYYDPCVAKDNRSYVLNSRFFADQLGMRMEVLKKKFDKEVFAESLKMIQDTEKRITDSMRLHFEVATNEIINRHSLKELFQILSRKDFQGVDDYCRRVKAKIETLGLNYSIMLKEQLDRCEAGPQEAAPVSPEALSSQ